MSHGLTAKDKMAFAGLTPWHWAETGKDGRAINLGDRATTAMHAFERAGLLWEVQKRPAFVLDDDGKPVAIPGQFGLRRNDDGTVFPTSVGSQFDPFQNRDTAEFCDSLVKQGEGELYCHTAGSLDGGARVWALMRVGAQVILDRNGAADVRNPYLMIRNAFGVGMKRKLIVALVTERVVCANTEAIALDGAIQTISVSHRGDMKGRMEEAARVLGFAHKRFEAHASFLQTLMDTPMTPQEFQGFAAALLTDSDTRDEAITKMRAIREQMGSSVDAVRRTARKRWEAIEHEGNILTDLFRNGAGNEGKTLHDAHAAVTDFVDHRRGNLDRWRKRAGALGVMQKRMDYTLFGDGAQLKARAAQLLAR